MQQDEPRIATVGIPADRSLTRSRLAVGCVLAVCVLFASLSAVLFVYQVILKDEFGDFYRDQPGARLHLLGHVLRTAVGMALAWSLWRYLRAVKKSLNASHGEAEEVFRALARWWNLLALSVLVLLSYGAWVAFGTSKPEPIRPLSRRFDAIRPEQSVVKVEFRVAERSPHEGYIEANVENNSQPIWLKPEPFLTNEDIAEARVVQDYRDQPAVQVKFVPAGQQKLYATMESNDGKLLAILIDGRVVTAPRISTPISGDATITGSFTPAEAERIAKGLSGRE